MKTIVATLLTILISQSAWSVGTCEGTFDGIQSTAEIESRFKKSKPNPGFYMSIAPILAYRITSADSAELPPRIYRALLASPNGAQDADSLRNFVGGAVILRMNDRMPKFYVVEKGFFENQFVPTDSAGLMEHNLMYFYSVKDVMGTLYPQEISNLEAVVEAQAIGLFRMSDLGFKIKDEVTVETKSGPVTKPANEDGFLQYDPNIGVYVFYRANSQGEPDGYIKVKF